jgi:hypothetical protein
VGALYGYASYGEDIINITFGKMKGGGGGSQFVYVDFYYYLNFFDF